MDQIRVCCRASSVRVGEIFDLKDGRWLYCKSLGRSWVEEDSMSIGAFRSRLQDDERREYAYCRLATEAEIVDEKERRRQVTEVREKKQRELKEALSVHELVDQLATDQPPKANLPEGKEYWIRRDLSIYGGGSYLLAGADGSLWYVRRNGADGDDWSQNNTDSSIARRVPDPSTALLSSVAALPEDIHR